MNVVLMKREQIFSHQYLSLWKYPLCFFATIFIHLKSKIQIWLSPKVVLLKTQNLILLGRFTI